MKNSKSKKRFIFFGLFPAFLLYTIFMIVPTINVFRESLYRTGGLSGNKEFVGLNNFKLLINDQNFIRAFQNTVFLIVIVTIVTMFMAIFFASILTREKLKGQNFFRIIFYIPNILSIAVVASIFAAIYGMDVGLINGLIRLFNEGHTNIPFLGNRNLVVYSMGFSMIWQAIGYYMVMYMSTMSQIPEQLYEAAKLDGSSKIQQFFDITLPLSWETVRTTLTFYVISNINIAFQIIKALTGGGPDGASMTLLNYQYEQAYTNSSFGYGLAIGVVVFLFSFILTAIIHQVTKNSNQNTRILKRAISYVTHREEEMKKYFADDLRLEVAAYPELNKYAVINNSLDDVESVVYDKDGNPRYIKISGGELIWFEGWFYGLL